MALRIGKKKADDADAPEAAPATSDWSEEALMAGNDGVDTTTAPVATATDSAVTDSGEPAAPAKRKTTALLFIGLAVLLLAVVGGAAWLFLGRAAPEEEDPAIVAQANTAPADSSPGDATSGDPGTVANATTDAPDTDLSPTSPDTPISQVPPNKQGIPPEGAQPPIVAAPLGVTPRVIPGPPVPTPVQPPMGMAGQPGRRADRSIQIVPAYASAAQVDLQELKRLWNLGAAAKQRGDFAAARDAWQQILLLDPGHAGIQEAIDKLPAQ